MQFKIIDEDSGCGQTTYRGDSDNLFVTIYTPNGIKHPNTLGDPSLDHIYDLSPQDELSINLIAPRCDSPEEEIEGLKALVKAREMLRQRGYSGELNKDDDLTEYVYTVKIKDPSEISKIFRDFSHVDTPLSNAGRKLEELFVGRLDNTTLDSLVANIDSELERVRLDTGSIGVVSFESDGKKGYGKVSISKSALLNENKALTELQNDRIGRILAPIPIGIVIDENAGALFTWGTENAGLYNKEDLDQYNSLFSTLLFRYSIEKKR